MAILLTLVALKNRLGADHGLKLVALQHYSPENNLYYSRFREERYKNETYLQVHPPFFGEWYVSQGYNGGITHLDDWQYALDFVVTDELKKTFKLPGQNLQDFYCYNLPVLSPAFGTVWQVIDGIDDNAIGDVDTNQNWGNTVIIKHADYLYSKLSHLKPGSIKVKNGDWVKKGDLIAHCGSSGRSPEPHLHFQMQSTPYVGSKTLQYPLSYFISRNYKTYTFHSFETPIERSTIMGVQQTPLIVNAFKFTPGEKIIFEVKENGQLQSNSRIETWECHTDAYNQTYLLCKHTQAMAYFVNNGTLHYFTDFVGDKRAFLHLFYLGAQKLVLGFYPQMQITDLLPVNSFYKGAWMIFHDIVAPFHLLLRTSYALQYDHIDDYNFTKNIILSSKVEAKLFGKVVKRMHFSFELNELGIANFRAKNKDFELQAKCIQS